MMLLVFSTTMLGLIFAAFMMYLAWEHNPQGEIHNENGIDWWYWFLVGLSWFLAITAVPYMITLAAFLWRRIRR